MIPSGLIRRISAMAAAAATVALCAAIITPQPARADDGVDADGTGVARVALIQGNVTIQRGDSETPFAAALNAPILGADYVATGDGARAEVEFDSRTMVRLGANTQARFARIENGQRTVQLAEGTIDFRLLRGVDGASEVDTPSISIVPRESGSYRVSVDPEGATQVTVRAGYADIVTPQGRQTLQPGTTLLAQGSADNPSVRVAAALAFDDFDAFNNQRDDVHQRALAAAQPYVNTEIGGIADLGDHGRWVDDGRYGNVWIPNDVPDDWAPYRDGRWVWEDGYGYTWVAAEPWGWAPYHYGRWYYSPAWRHWAWYPPAPAVIAPAWSPALVGFIGFSIGAVQVGLGFGNLAWVPLAPFEPVHPWWGPRVVNTTVVNNVTNNYYVNNNVTNINHYRNIQVNNAVTSVSTANFQAGRFDRRVAISTAQLRTMQSVQPLQGRLPVAPTVAHLRYTDAAPAAVPAAFHPVARTFAGNTPVQQRTPFSTQRAAFVQPAPAAVPAWRTPQAGLRAPVQAAPERPASIAPAVTRRSGYAANDAWSRFGTNRGTTNAPASAGYRQPGTNRESATYRGPSTYRAPSSYGGGATNRAAAGYDGQPTYRRAASSGYAQRGPQSASRYPSSYSAPRPMGRGAEGGHASARPAGGESAGGQGRGYESRGERSAR